MNYNLIVVAACIVFFIAMCFLPGLGRRIARRTREGGPPAEDSSTPVITAALYALLGLLTAFTFSGAFSRLEVRRQMLIEETNAIGTAYLRLDLLPEEHRAPLRELFARYTASRASLYPSLADPPAALAEHGRSVAMQEEIWARALAGCRESDTPAATQLLVPALNDMIDITTTRLVAIRTHQPPIIFVTLVVLAFVCAAFTGYQSAAAGRMSRWSAFGLAAVLSFVFYVIFDAEYPRIGIIRLDAVNALLVELAESMR